MSSGQQRVQFNNGERVISDDFNKFQNMIARERNELIRALVMQTWCPTSPGVTVRPEAANMAPLPGVVVDGLEAIVDTPGYVMISPGTLAAWVANPADASIDSGFRVVTSSGITWIDTGMVIAANGGASARCDVIEVSISTDGATTTENRDVYDPASEYFIANAVTKTVSSSLVFRVRTGTPGTPPGYAAGWMPLALAIVQPGVTLDKVDFYDVRPLWRELVGAYHTQSRTGRIASINHHSSHFMTNGGGSTVANMALSGWCDAEFAGTNIVGKVARNTPIIPGDIAYWGSATAYLGGDGPGVALHAGTCARGTGLSVAPMDKIQLCAFFPTLGGEYVVPRMVRYCQSIANNDPVLPNRRRATGVNGLLMYVSKSQEGGYDLTTTRQIYPITLVSTGIDGCLGTAFGVPVANVDVKRNASDIDVQAIGMLTPASQGLDGFCRIPYATMNTVRSYGLGAISDHVTSDTGDTGHAVAVTLISDFAQSGDILDMVWGPFVVTAVVNTVCKLEVRVTEDYGGTPTVYKYTYTYASSVSGLIQTCPIQHRVDRGGTVRVQVYMIARSGDDFTLTQQESVMNSWLNYKRIRA